MQRFQHYGFLVIMSLFLLIILSVNIYRTIDYPKIKSSACLESFTLEELEFFSEVGFLDSYVTKKWTKDIRVAMDGNPMEEDELIVDSIIEELNPLIDPLKIVRSNDHPNLVIRFTEDKVKRQAMGFTLFHQALVFSAKIKNAEMEIFSKVRGQARQACIRHEFLHALGLTHPVRRNTGTLIESRLDYINDSDSVKLYRYTSLDKSSLKILYSDCLRVGLKKKTFLKALKLQTQTLPGH